MINAQHPRNRWTGRKRDHKGKHLKQQVPHKTSEAQSIQTSQAPSGERATLKASSKTKHKAKEENKCEMEGGRYLSELETPVLSYCISMYLYRQKTPQNPSYAYRITK